MGWGRGGGAVQLPLRGLRGKEATRGESHWEGKTVGGGGVGLGYVALGPADPQ